MIIYNKLGDYLKSKNMKYIDLQREIGLSPTIVAKFQKNRSVTIDTVDKVCTYLHCQPGDIMEWVENENEAEKKQIEAQIASLQAKLKQM
mgnify:FL=1